MEGYYILSVILIIFFIGIISIICDMILNKEEEIIFKSKPAPQENFAKFIVDNYHDDDDDRALGF